MPQKPFLFYLLTYICAAFLFAYGTSLADEDGVSVASEGPIQIIPVNTMPDPSEFLAPGNDANYTSPSPPLVSQKQDFVQSGEIAIERVQESYRLGPGDEINVTVFDEAALSKTYRVSDKGTIAMPLIGDLFVGGKTVSQAVFAVKSALSDGYLKNPDVVMEVVKFRPIYITGEVSDPGHYDFITDMTVLNAVVVAGGYTYRANKKEHDILRESSDGTSFKFEDKPNNVKVMPGDIIIVKERFF